jgi:protein DGCR14
VKGYGFVDASPSPMPGRSFGDESPMMTWGEIESTPFRLDSSATPYFAKTPNGPEFKIPDVPEREKLLFDLEEKNSAARRKKKNDAVAHVQRNLASPSKKTPKNVALGSLSERINSMSPAAKQLLSMKLNVKTGDKSANSSPYTPKDSSTTPRASPFNGLSSPHVKPTSSQSIDNLRSTVKRTASSSATESLTDNLLKLPKMT